MYTQLTGPHQKLILQPLTMLASKQQDCNLKTMLSDLDAQKDQKEWQIVAKHMNQQNKNHSHFVRSSYQIFPFGV